MFAYALVGYLDYETEECFKALWKDLSEDNITQYGVETKGKRPHITIADYDNLKKDIFVELLNKFYEDKAKIDLSLNILGTFMNTGTLFIAPAMSSELLNFHSHHHTYFKAFNENENSFYLPGKWNPHCTIASRLSVENMVQAFKHCKTNLSKINGKLNEIALLEVEFSDQGVAIEDTVIFSKILK